MEASLIAEEWKMGKAKWTGPREQLEAARDPSCESCDLKDLARSSYGFVRVAVAENPASAADVLRRLVPQSLDASEDKAVALALAKRNDCPAGVLADLASTIAGGLGDAVGPDAILLSAQAVAENPNSTLQTLGELAGVGLGLDLNEQDLRSGLQAHLAERRRSSLIRRALLVALETRGIPYELGDSEDFDLIAKIPTTSSSLGYYRVLEDLEGVIIFSDENLHTHVECYENLSPEQVAKAIAELACDYLQDDLSD